jgi:hypothetical protein
MRPDWPFPDPKNVATITVRQIIHDGRPILRVTHDRDDGVWQFLEWETPREEDAMVVSLEGMTQLDKTILELADLPRGWQASRRSPTEPWHREPAPDDGGHPWLKWVVCMAKKVLFIHPPTPSLHANVNR